MVRSVWFWFLVVCTVLLMIPVGFEAPPKASWPVKAPVVAVRSEQALPGQAASVSKAPQAVPAQSETLTNVAPANEGQRLYFPEILPKDLPLHAETAELKAMMPVLVKRDSVHLGQMMLSGALIGMRAPDADPMHLQGRCGGAIPSAYLVTRHEPDECPAP